MDRKSVIVLIICALLFLIWAQLVPRLYPPPPPAQRTNQPAIAHATNLPERFISPGSNLPPAAEVSAPAPSAPEELLVVSNANARYTFTSHGGGLKLIELEGFPESISCRGKTPPGAERFSSLNTLAPQPLLNLAAWGLLGDSVFKLARIDGGVRAEKTFTNGLSLIKEFRPSSNYLVDASVRLTNHGDQTIALPAREWSLGTATPMNPNDNGQMVGVMWYNGSSSQNVDQSWFANRTLGCFAGTPRAEYRAIATNLVWTASHNQFFTLAVMTPTNSVPGELIIRQITLPPLHNETNASPATHPSAETLWLFEEADFKDAPGFANRLKSAPDSLSAYLAGRLSDETRRLLGGYQGGEIPKALLHGLVVDLNSILQNTWISQDNRDYFARLTLKPTTRRLLEQNPSGDGRVRINRLVLEEAYPRELQQSPIGYETALSYPPAPLLPKQSLSGSFTIYAGPKEYRTINLVGLQFNNSLEAVMGYSGFFGFFAKLLLLSMNGLHELGLSYAAAIIAITVIIKTLFWPLTQASTRSMKRMQALQPQIKAIQDKYKDDPMKAQRKVMEVWKEHKISPLGGCLPMFLQLPVFLGFYRMIQSAIELRGAKFLWVCDLSRPDTLFIIPGLNFPFNPLPLIMGVTMLWQARLSPPSPGMDPAQQRIMKYMPLMFLFILYNFSAGLTLYWTVQNLLTIAQTKLTRAKEEKAGTTLRPPPGPPPKRQK